VVGYVPWLAVRWLHGIGATSEHISQFQPAALGAVLLAVVAVLGGVRTGGGVVAAALVWLTAGRQLLLPGYRLLTLVVLRQLIATILDFLISSPAPAHSLRAS